MKDILRDNIELTYNDSRNGVDINVTLLDKHGNYDSDFKLSNNQAFDLLEALKSIENLIKKDEF